MARQVSQFHDHDPSLDLDWGSALQSPHLSNPYPYEDQPQAPMSPPTAEDQYLSAPGTAASQHQLYGGYNTNGGYGSGYDQGNAYGSGYEADDYAAQTPGLDHQRSLYSTHMSPRITPRGKPTAKQLQQMTKAEPVQFTDYYPDPASSQYVYQSLQSPSAGANSTQFDYAMERSNQRLHSPYTKSAVSHPVASPQRRGGRKRGSGYSNGVSYDYQGGGYEEDNNGYGYDAYSQQNDGGYLDDDQYYGIDDNDDLDSNFYDVGEYDDQRDSHSYNVNNGNNAVAQEYSQPRSRSKTKSRSRSKKGYAVSKSKSKSRMERKEPPPKPKPVRPKIEYKPYKLSDFKQLPVPERSTLGGDTETPELVEKRERLDLIRQLSRNIRMENARRIMTNKPRRSRSNAAVSKRERAKQFASTIPKPVVRRNTVGQSSSAPSERKPEEDMSALELLDRRHQQAQQSVAEIRRQFASMVV